MKLIIEIPKEYCELYKSAWEHLDHLHWEHDFNFTQELAIANGILLPNVTTNGDVIKALFSNDIADVIKNRMISDWWNEPYKEVENARI